MYRECLPIILGGSVSIGLIQTKIQILDTIKGGLLNQCHDVEVFLALVDLS